MGYVIISYKKIDWILDINNALLCDDLGNTFQIRHLTKCGYFSKSKLSPYFEYVETKEDGQHVLCVTDEVAKTILETSCNLNGKVWGVVTDEFNPHELQSDYLNRTENTDPNQHLGVKGIDY